MQKNKEYFEQISIEEFSNFFDKFKHEAFRIELMQQYLVDGEKDLYEKSKQSILKDSEFLKYHNDWLKFLERCKKSKKSVLRVHAIKKPYSSYLKFEIDYSYKYNLKYGETIKLLIIDNEFEVFLNKYEYIGDFWLFDNKDCIFLKYDRNGTFLGVQKIKKKYLNEIISIKEYCLDKSSYLHYK